MAPYVATLIVVVTLALILTDKLDHTTAAAGGAAAMMIAGLVLGFYSEEQALESMHFGALGLLLGMMVLVAILAPTGFFQYVAIKAGQLSRGSPWRLLLLLGSTQRSRRAPAGRLAGPHLFRGPLCHGRRAGSRGRL